MLPFSLRSPDKPLTNERKFAGRRDAWARVTALLDARCLPDRYHPENRIASVYFDTPDLQAWDEKANGDRLKRKIRLRWYDDDPSPGGRSRVYLERKDRIGAARDKKRLDLEAPADWIRQTPLDDPSWTAFLARHAEELGVPPAGWAPVCCISYSRIRYNDLAGGFRVSVDWDIRCDRAHPGRFPWAVPLALDDLVCEFKARGAPPPPPWAEHMEAAGLRLRSYSKYGEIMRRLVENVL